MELRPIRFIGDPIEVMFDREPLLEKKQGCPARFRWQGEDFKVVEMLREWHDYARKGRFARNMQPQHAAVAKSRGSWGVGRDFFTVCTNSDRIFTIYFDRAPRDAFTHSSGWFLLEELSILPDQQ
jgi:hypothetical protein